MFCFVQKAQFIKDVIDVKPPTAFTRRFFSVKPKKNSLSKKSFWSILRIRAFALQLDAYAATCPQVVAGDEISRALGDSPMSMRFYASLLQILILEPQTFVR